MIPLTEENMRAVAMENDSSTEIEVDAYLSGSVVQALTQKSVSCDGIDDDHSLTNTLNNTNVEIQAGREPFKVQCQNIGKGPDGIFRMCVLDNGEVINSLKNHIGDSSYAVPEIINSGYEGVYEDNSEPILNIASESIQSTQFLENVAVAQDAFTVQDSTVPSNYENTDATACSKSLTDTIDVLSDLAFTRVVEDEPLINNELDVPSEWIDNFVQTNIHQQNEPISSEFFMPDFDTLLWSEENNSLEPSYLDEVDNDKSNTTNEYVDIDDLAFLSRTAQDLENVEKSNEDQNLCNELSDNLREVLQTCSNKTVADSTSNKKKPCTRNCSKNETDKSSCCVTVCLNTLKQLRKVLEQRCCMTGKTSLM